MKFSLNEHRLIHLHPKEGEVPSGSAADEHEQKRLLQTGFFKQMREDVFDVCRAFLGDDTRDIRSR